jgi:hypothetical protein
MENPHGKYGINMEPKMGEWGYKGKKTTFGEFHRKKK